MNKRKTDKTAVAVIAVIVFIVIGGFAVRGYSEKTKLSAAGQMGNTASNLYNYGLFCSDGDRYYFSNYRDQGLLYSMSKDLDDFKFITNDVVRYINTDDNYIIYSRMNNLKDESARSIFVFYSNGIFRIGKNGRNQKMLWNEPIGSLLSYDNKLYYQYYAENEKLATHRIDLDGSNDKALFSDESCAVSLYNSKLYYAGVRSDRNLYSADIDSGSSSTVIEGGFYNPIVNSNGIYYIALNDGYKLKRCDLDGENERTISNDRISTYNISPDNRYIYYQVDSGSKSGIYVFDITTEESSLIKLGNFKWINTVDDICFFYSFDEAEVFYYKSGSDVKYFEPPVLSNK